VCSSDLFKKILQDKYQVFCARSGRQAMKMITSQPVDLILLDTIMPDMDGYELCRWLKANPGVQDIPVIFISIKGTPLDEAAGFALGAVDYITKPTDAAVIKARINSHLELKKQRDKLARLSVVDDLTGIANRRCFNKALPKLWRYALRNNDFLSMQIIDIDFFKNYNDRYGHLAGDQCLKQVAHALTCSLMRSVDIVARYGGEEFAVLLPSTPRNGAIQVAKRIQENIYGLKIEHQSSTVSDFLTVSIGIAAIKPEEDLDPSILIEKADCGLYQAKNGGRNRFILIE
jgi:diguanylate cyclase (GGDEF)-like protein